MSSNDNMSENDGTILGLTKVQLIILVIAAAAAVINVSRYYLLLREHNKGFIRYITTASQIPDNTMQQLQNEAVEALQTRVNDEWNAEHEWLKDYQYVGNYLVTACDGVDTQMYDQLYRKCSITGTTSKKKQPL